MAASEIAGILLAAGSSTRFGGDKLLHPLPDGTPVAVAAARSLLAAAPNACAVVRPGDRRLVAALSALGLAIVENPLAARGMGTSLAAGVRATRGADGWIIALADMPWIRPGTIASLVDGLRDGAAMIAPVHEGRRGHPVGFSARWRHELCRLTGDTGARGLLRAHHDLLERLQTDDPGVVSDIDYRDQVHQAASAGQQDGP
jgi:molybdenum cofactor cytidylyltransferase